MAKKATITRWNQPEGINDEPLDERDRARLTCQVCGRNVKVKNELTSHHGYNRPGWGYIVGTCMGARRKPAQTGINALAAHIIAVNAMIESKLCARARMEAEEVTLALGGGYTFEDYYTHSEARKAQNKACREVPRHCTRETFDAVKAKLQEVWGRSYSLPHSFDDLKDWALVEIDRDIKQMRDHREMQQNRLALWHVWHNEHGITCSAEEATHILQARAAAA